jgi:hypothetical protein
MSKTSAFWNDASDWEDLDPMFLGNGAQDGEQGSTDASEQPEGAGE